LVLRNNSQTEGSVIIMNEKISNLLMQYYENQGRQVRQNCMKYQKLHPKREIKEKI